MNQDDFKKIIDSALKPIIETQKEHTQILKFHSQKLEEHSESLESLKSSVINIEATNVVYGDMYKINKGDAKKLEKRVEALEKNLGIDPPPELAIA